MPRTHPPYAAEYRRRSSRVALRLPPVQSRRDPEHPDGGSVDSIISQALQNGLGLLTRNRQDPDAAAPQL
jgi:hypothetical protein